MPTVTLFQVSEDLVPMSPVAHVATHADRLRELAERIAPLHVLRNTGYRPFAFNGQVLATVCGIDQVLLYWYEINVYVNVLGAYVSDIRVFGKGVNSNDLFRVAEHEDLEALHTYFEHYDPCGDLPPIRYDTSATSAAALTLQAIELQAEMRRISDHYQSTVGALLNALAG
ncbi:hypothetical protein [Sphingomonas sp. PAMC 26621]|uniref:hypothetical protein n=1 Tax=Sphingomonas sp. PAMC 26621 TaxID=1112213 RepID=UPI0002889AEB|nr:hypothetical protein [Sphingomonas sp. PAMC 26621]